MQHDCRRAHRVTPSCFRPSLVPGVPVLCPVKWYYVPAEVLHPVPGEVFYLVPAPVSAQGRSCSQKSVISLKKRKETSSLFQGNYLCCK